MPRGRRILPVIPAIESALFFGADAAPAVRSYILHPFTLVMLGLAPLLKFIGYMPVEFPVLTLWGDIAIYILRWVIYIYIAVKFMPIIIPKLMSRNIPFAVATFLFFLTFVIPAFVILHALLPRGLTIWQEGYRLLSVIILSAFCHLIVMRIVEADVVRLLGREPKLIPYYFPIKSISSAVPYASLVDPAFTGTVISLRAQNQYVLVHTDEGEKLVRMTLRTAIDLFPEGCGQQIHRSWWLCTAEIMRSSYDPDALQLETSEGRVYPVGKTFVPVVEDLIGSR